MPKEAGANRTNENLLIDRIEDESIGGFLLQGKNPEEDAWDTDGSLYKKKHRGHHLIGVGLLNKRSNPFYFVRDFLPDLQAYLSAKGYVVEDPVHMIDHDRFVFEDGYEQSIPTGSIILPRSFDPLPLYWPFVLNGRKAFYLEPCSSEVRSGKSETLYIWLTASHPDYEKAKSDILGYLGKCERTCKYCRRDYQESDRTVLSNKMWFANFDGHPVNPGHMKLIPKRHVEIFDRLTDPELIAFGDIYRKVGKLVMEREKYRPRGMNAGWNEGEAAGQTVPHLHIHYMPRYPGDVADPVGGIRGIIPGRGNYLKLP